MDSETCVHDLRLHVRSNRKLLYMKMTVHQLCPRFLSNNCLINEGHCAHIHTGDQAYKDVSQPVPSLCVFDLEVSLRVVTFGVQLGSVLGEALEANLVPQELEELF